MKRIRIIFFTGWIGMLCSFALSAQNYQAIHGSSQAGALGAANNPASIVHVPFSWDLTLFAVQEKHTTNAFYLTDYSLISPGKNSTVLGFNETSKRFAFATQDIHLLNARIRLNQRQAIAFGVNLKSYLHAKTSAFTFSDTATEIRHFMDINKGNIPLHADLVGSSWVELFGTYAQTIWDNEYSILNAGITLSLSRGLAGAQLRATDLGFTASPADPEKFILNDIRLQYRYSANIDDVDAAAKGRKRAELLRRTFPALGLSAGAEYIVPMDKAGDENNGYNYDLKIGVALLDLGFNNYRHSANSRGFVFDGSNIPDSLLQEKFDGTSSIEEINDTLGSLASSVTTFDKNFRVFQPARIVLNVDKHLQGNFFVNGELSVPITGILGKERFAIKDINLLAITPRYETRTFGAYLPFTVNTRGQSWIGGAVRAGPLLLGLHNWANIFAKDKMQEGGFYLALTFRPGKKNEQAARKDGPKLTKKQRRQLECPVL